MSYVIKTVLSNPRRPECGQITIPFPIPADQYDQTIEMLRAMDLGHAMDRDCTVDDVDSHYSVLSTLNGTLVNVDQLDYLAKRLDSFCVGEDAQFQAMACKLELKDVKDFINLTFCCQQVTVITDFSDLESIGRSHFLNLNGGSARTEELEHLDGAETALLLIDSGGEAVTPYGVVYDNGMVLKELYNGHQFPAYLYDSPLMVLEVTPKQGLAEGKNPEHLYFPASEHQIERTLLRVGIDTMSDARVRLDFDELPEKVAEALNLERLSDDDLSALNRMCQVISTMNEADMEKLNAVVLMAKTSGVVSICRLAENLGQFSFVPGVQTPEAYGRYMIRQSGKFQYDEDLEDCYDYRRYGEQCVRQESGQFNECGYVVYHGGVPLEELMRDIPMEPRRESPAPRQEPPGKIALTLATADRWYYLTLPASEVEMTQAKQDLDVEDFSQAGITAVKFSAPRLDSLIPLDTLCVEDANTLAHCLQKMEREEGELTKFCAVLEVEPPDTLAEVLKIAMNRDDYELVPENAEEYGKQVLRRIGADDEIINTIDGYMDFAQLGSDSLAEDGVRRTEFGLVRRLNNPFPPEPELGQTML